MKTTHEYFAHYEAIAALSSCMLAAARSGEWGELKTMQGAYRDLVDGLREVDPRSELDDSARAQARTCAPDSGRRRCHTRPQHPQPRAFVRSVIHGEQASASFEEDDRVSLDAVDVVVAFAAR